VNGRLVGTVEALMRFPVKSMRGETLETAELHWTGIAGDRIYGFVRTQNRSDFPWLTGRGAPSLLLCRPSPRDRDAPVSVTLPSGDEVPLDSPSLRARLEQEAGEPVHLLHVSRGLFDAMPVSLASTATLAALDSAHGAALERRRFRLNIVIDSAESDLDWRSGRLVFASGAELLVNDGIPRCALITIDPQTAERDPRIMRTVAQRFDNQLGVYAAAAKPGSIRVGDAVRLVR
jgi:uncharacterized protein YcbX